MNRWDFTILGLIVGMLALLGGLFWYLIWGING